MNIRYEEALQLCARLHEEHQTLFKSERCIRHNISGVRMDETVLHDLHKFRKPTSISQCASYAETLSRDIKLMRKQQVRLTDEDDAVTQQQLREASHILYNKTKPERESLLTKIYNWWWNK